MIFSSIQGLGLPEILILLLFALWIWALIDIIRRTDFSGPTRGVWIFPLLLFFFATPIIYLIVKRVSKTPIPDPKLFSKD